ncbi:MAG: hypothetical protein M1826_005221 [Phylliscum demangeonii]|nr:MAG: hypothetical protein M1826_005221 [Phylliscum demangeonii]
MSSKLDRSLDEILSDRRQSGRRGRGRANGNKTTTITGPIGGVRKSSRIAKANLAKAAALPTGPLGHGDSKIIVSGLPYDVNESQIKDYFAKSIAPVKRCQLTYGPNGLSRGTATLTFTRADGAGKAVRSNGLLVDGKPIKIEVVVDASRASNIPRAKGLGERITQPKNQPRSAVPKEKNSGKSATGRTRGGSTTNARGRGRGGRRGGARTGSHAPKKTAEQLDQDMNDYYAGTEVAEGNINVGVAHEAANGAANGDANVAADVMDHGIL